MLTDLAESIPGRPRSGLGRGSIMFDWAPFVFRVARSGAGLENMPTDLAGRIPGRPGPGSGRITIVLDWAPFVFESPGPGAGLEKCAARFGCKDSRPAWAGSGVELN